MENDDRYMDDGDLEIQKRRRGPVRRSKKGGWTKEEDEILRAAVQEFNGRSWKKIAERLPNRSNVQCLHRWQKVLNPELVKGPWTPEEDEKIIDLVKKYGCENWSLIANFLDGRIGKQCRERYFNQLDPSIKKTPWTEEEKNLLMDAHARLGNKWAEISKIVVGRPNNQCKNMFHSIMAKLKKEKRGKEGEGNGEDEDESQYSDDLSTTYSESYSESIDEPAPMHSYAQRLASMNRDSLRRGLHARSYSDSAVLHFQNFLDQPFMYQNTDSPSQYLSMVQNSIQNTYGASQPQSQQQPEIHVHQHVQGNEFINQQQPTLDQQQLQTIQQLQLLQQQQQQQQQYLQQQQFQQTFLQQQTPSPIQIPTPTSFVMDFHTQQANSFAGSGLVSPVDKILPDINMIDDHIPSPVNPIADYQEKSHFQDDIMTNSNPMERRRSYSIDLQSPVFFEESKNITFFDFPSPNYDAMEDNDNDDGLKESLKDDFDLGLDIDPTSPDVFSPTTDLFDSPKTRRRGHQRSLSLDPKLFRFQPF